MSGSQLRTTPARAITTTIVTRSSPSIPPSNQTYEAIVRSILRHRLLYNIFLYSALLSWASMSLWTAWGQGNFQTLGIGSTLLVPLIPSTLFLAFVRWAIGMVPGVVLRKIYLTPTRTPASSPAILVQSALSKSCTTHTILVYSLSAIVDVTLHIIMAYVNEPRIHGDPKLSPFVKSKKHPYYLNGRLLFLMLSQLSIALGYSIRNILLDRFVFPWSLAASVSSGEKRNQFRLVHVIRSIMISAVFTTLTLTIASLSFGLLRLAYPFIYKLPLLHKFLRPFTAHFLRGSWTLLLPFQHIPLLFRAWFLGFTTTFSWEVSNVLFDAFVSQPISVAHITTEPHVTLVSGISSPDITFRYFAYKEFKSLASDQSTSAVTLRTAFFNDQKYSPTLWSYLARESLLLLGRDYQHFLRRGKPAVNPHPAVQVPMPTTSNNPLIKATSVSLIRGPVFQSSKPSSPIRNVIESLGSDGPLSQALDAGAEAAHIPELFKSVETAVFPTPAKEEVKKTVESATSTIEYVSRRAFRTALSQLSPVWVSRAVTDLSVWWTKSRLEKTVQGCLPNMEMDIVVIEVLSHLICASLNEDKYGVVQRDIPKILEAILSFHAAIEDYQAEIRALYAPPAPDKDLNVEDIEKVEAQHAEVVAAGEILNAMNDGLKEGVVRIARTFGDKLLAFKFPPRTAQKLQPFLEYY